MVLAYYQVSAIPPHLTSSALMINQILKDANESIALNKALQSDGNPTTPLQYLERAVRGIGGSVRVSSTGYVTVFAPDGAFAVSLTGDRWEQGWI